MKWAFLCNKSVNAVAEFSLKIAPIRVETTHSNNLEQHSEPELTSLVTLKHPSFLKRHLTKDNEWLNPIYSELT